MFSTLERLKKRTPAGGIGREEFIEHLVEEFHTTTNIEAQEQVTANLANFAYDPINSPFLKKSGALNVFLECLRSPNDTLILHGIAGICNLCLDDYFQNILIQPQHLENVVSLLDRDHTEIVIDTITTLYLIVNEQTKEIICTPEIIQAVSKFQQSPNVRIRNIATVFIEDYGNQGQESGMQTS